MPNYDSTGWFTSDPNNPLVIPDVTYNPNKPPVIPPYTSTSDFETRFKERVELERQRRMRAGLNVSEGWASPEWLNQLRNEMLQEETQKKSDELSDPNSKYYTDFTKKLKGILSGQSSLNSLLGLNRAMGLGMESSATIANEQRKAVEGKITDYAGQSAKELFQANLGQSNSLLGMGLQNTADLRNYYFQKEQYNDSKKFDWGGLAQTAGTIAGYLLAPATGGVSIPISQGLNTAIGSMNKNSQSSGYGTGRWYKDPYSGQWKYGG